MSRLGLASRLWIAQTAVLAAAGAALTLVAALVAPALFHTHLVRAGHGSDSARAHVEEAFGQTMVVSLAAGALAAVAAASIVSVLSIRRIVAPVRRLSRAATRIADGDLAVPIERTAPDADLARLESAFAAMAAGLADTERARGRLVQDLAHELRTPIATLVAYVDAVEDGVRPADATSWTVMRDQLARLTRLVSDVRDMSAVEEGVLRLHRTRVDLREPVRAAVDAVRPRYHTAGVALVAHGLDRGPDATGGPTPFDVDADRHRIEQILANLLDNAVRHTPPGGAVTVEVAPTGSGHVTVRVRDTGEGLAADELDAVFARFHRVGGHGTHGSGLGLTIARALATAHGGTLVAASDGPGTGSTFTVTLPR